MQFSVIDQSCIDVLNTHVNGLHLLVQKKVFLLRGLKTVLKVSSIFLDFVVQVLNHVGQIGSQAVNVIILQLNLL